ncbi:MAG: hypothetical protein J5372_03210 [Lachnospiraceae bacterium]|nr:hypothetical protein [Lachnospiraceae bacterium]MBR4146251.1 hypothetical protein [Lachnospiraceae bacterium]MBR6476648.1 hypothetical protein [Lachnospiraceae bacterium]
MIEWSEKLYLTDSVKKKVKKIRKKIEKPDKIRFGAYLVTLNDNGTDLFDIYNILMFPAKHFKKEDTNVKIVGIAKDEDEAKLLVIEMIKLITANGTPLTSDGLKEFFKASAK